jgi:hypothetical protein
MSKDMQIRNSTVEFLVFTAQNGGDNIEVRFENENIWLAQKMMAKLFDVQVPAVSKHLANIFTDGELDEKVVIFKMETTTAHGAIVGKTQTAKTNFYNLDAVISVGYRVNSVRATQFRQWATGVLTTYARQGYIIDKDRMKNGVFLGQNITKNYLTKSELEDLGNLVEAFLDLATDRAKRHIPMTMEDWANNLSKFIEFADRDVLNHLGNTSQEQAKEWAPSEFEKYRPIQDAEFINDFERSLELFEVSDMLKGDDGEY